MQLTSLSPSILGVLDQFVELVHCGVIFVVTFGWLIPRLRKLHLALTGLVLFSWIFLGFWYGWGYCFLTDFQWEIKRVMGIADLPYSFIGYIFEKYLKLSLSEIQINVLCYGLLGFILSMTATMNVIAYRRLRSNCVVAGAKRATPKRRRIGNC